MPDSIPRKQTWLLTSTPEVMWGQNAAEGLGNLKGIPSSRSTPPTPTPSQIRSQHPSSHRLLDSERALHLGTSPQPSSLPFFCSGPSPQQPCPQPALPAPSLPSPVPLQPPPPTASHSLPAHTSMGRGAWGTGPFPSQAAAAVVAAGCISVSVSVPRGRQDLGMS